MIKGQGSRVKGQGRKTTIKILMLLILVLPCTLCYAETLSSNELIEKAKEYDGKQVIYKGEVVTAILNRGEYSWVNLNDGYNAIGIWCNASKLKQVKFIGDYKHRGDILEVEGMFNRACPAHGGELDIHADRVNLEKAGFSTEEKTDKRKLNLASILFLITISVIIIFRKRI